MRHDRAGADGRGMWFNGNGKTIGDGWVVDDGACCCCRLHMLTRSTWKNAQDMRETSKGCGRLDMQREADLYE